MRRAASSAITKPSFRRHGRARCRKSNSGDASQRPCMSMELQGREVRIVFGGSQRYAETDVHDANERIAARQTDHGRADESVSGAERFDYGRVMEFSGEEKNQEVQTAPT